MNLRHSRAISFQLHHEVEGTVLRLLPLNPFFQLHHEVEGAAADLTIGSIAFQLHHEVEGCSYP